MEVWRSSASGVSHCCFNLLYNVQYTMYTIQCIVYIAGRTKFLNFDTLPNECVDSTHWIVCERVVCCEDILLSNLKSSSLISRPAFSERIFRKF